jgi:Protein of unknown function (DUF3352)
MDTTSLGPAGSGLDISKLSQQFLGTDLQDYFDFVGDAAVGVSPSGDSFVAGMVASVDDSTVARERVDKLVSLLTAFGFTAGINVETVDHNGTEITVISLADPPADLPPFSLALTVAGDRLYVGAQDWVTAALDRQASDSLWSSDRFQKAITTGGNDNAGVVYLDLAGLMASPAMGSQHTDQADFETNVKPFLEPLDTLTVIRRVDGGIVVTNAFLFVE